LIIENLISCGTESCFPNETQNPYIALRTQNPQVYEYFIQNYDIHPKIGQPSSPKISEVAHWVHQQYSPNKDYEEDNMIIRAVFPKGIIVGHLHPAKKQEINNFFNSNLDVLGGDSYILVSENLPK